MRDPVQIVHEDTGRVVTVPRRTVKVLAESGWRLASAPEPVPVEIGEREPEFTAPLPVRSWFTDDGPDAA